MNNEEYLAQVTIPVPCPQEWRRMRGDGRTRHCDLCGKNVHNLAAMTADEVVALIKKSDGPEICGLVTRRPDGALLTSDRQPRLSRLSNPWQFKIGGLMAFIACLAPLFGMIRFLTNSPVRFAGAIRVRSAYSGSAAQCSDTDPDEVLDPEACLDSPPTTDPTPSPSGSHP